MRFSAYSIVVLLLMMANGQAAFPMSPKSIFASDRQFRPLRYLYFGVQRLEVIVVVRIGLGEFVDFDFVSAKVVQYLKR
jgi:hypothetical protein